MNKEKLDEVISLQKKVEEKSSKFDCSPEQARWITQYIVIVKRKNVILGEVLKLDGEIASTITKMEKTPKFPHEIIDLMKEARTFLTTNIPLKFYSDVDMKQMKNIQMSEFYGYSPIDIETIISKLDRTLTGAMAIMETSNGKYKTTEGLEKIQEDLKNLNTDFDKITTDQLNTHHNKPDPKDEINALKQKATAFKSKAKSLDSATNSLARYQNGIQIAIDNAFELSEYNEVTKIFEPLKIGTQFVVTFSQQLRAKNKFELDFNLKKEFATIWSQVNKYEAAIQKNALKLQEIIIRVNDLKTSEKTKKVFEEVIFRLISIKYLVKKIHDELCIPLDSWYGKMCEKLLTLNEPVPKWRVENIIKTSNTSLNDLYGGFTPPMDKVMDQFKRFTENLENSLGEIINEANTNKMEIKIIGIQAECSSFRSQLMKVLTFAESRTDAYYFRESENPQ